MGGHESKEKPFEFNNPNMGAKSAYPTFGGGDDSFQYDTPQGKTVNLKSAYDPPPPATHDSDHMDSNPASHFQQPQAPKQQQQQPIFAPMSDEDAHLPAPITEAPKDSGYLAVDPQWLQEQFALMTGLPWFRGRQNRQDAYKELAKMPAGSFVVRVSSQPGHYAISAQLGYKIESMLCLPSWDPTRTASGETVYRLGSTSKRTFDSIPALIDYYTRYPFYQDQYGARHLLRYPDAKTDTPAGYMDFNPEGERAAPTTTEQSPVYDTASNAQIVPTPIKKVSKEVGYIEIAGESTDDIDDETLNQYDTADFAREAVAKKDNSNPFLSASTVTTSRGQELTDSELSVFQGYFEEADAANQGFVGAGDAVKFFASSGLPNAVLKIIWSLADNRKVGYLDRDAFFVALKMVALKQNDLQVSLDNLNVKTPLPNFD